MNDLTETLDRVRRQLGAFHEVVEHAHRRAVVRTVEQTLRRLRYLGDLAHRTTQDSWNQALAALQDVAAGVPEAAASLEASSLTPAALAERARHRWQENLGEAVADVLGRLQEDPDELSALAQAVRTFFDELDRAAREHAAGGDDR